MGFDFGPLVPPGSVKNNPNLGIAPTVGRKKRKKRRTPRRRRRAAALRYAQSQSPPTG